MERFAASHTSPSHTSKSQESPQASKQVHSLDQHQHGVCLQPRSFPGPTPLLLRPDAICRYDQALVIDPCFGL
jgi:hypothetical protein